MIRLKCYADSVITEFMDKPVIFATQKIFTCRLLSTENPVWTMHDFTEIRIRVLRSKAVLENCKKGRLFLVVGAERERLAVQTALSHFVAAESSLAFAAYRRYTPFRRTASREKLNDVTV